MREQQREKGKAKKLLCPRMIRLLVCILMLILLTACQSGESSHVWQQTVSCPRTARPQLTSLTPNQSSLQSVYFTSTEYLYAMNAGNGTFRWCTRLKGTESELANGFDYSELSSLTFHAGRLYVNSYEGYMDVFKAASGSLLWQSAHGNDGLDVNPTVTDEAVYVGKEALFALKPQDGSVLWQYDPEGFGTPSPDSPDIPNTGITPPVIANGVVYLASSSGKGQTWLTSLRALDAKTGATRWVIPRLPSPNFQLNSSLVVEDGKILAILDGKATAFDAQTGRILWQWGEKNISLQLLGGGGHLLYVAEPMQYENQKAVNHPRLYALSMENGAPTWSVPAVDDPGRFHILATNDTLYLAEWGEIYAYNAQDGALLWHTEVAEAGGEVSGPILINGEIYVVAQGYLQTLLHAINAQNGHENWYVRVPGTKIAGPMDVAG